MKKKKISKTKMLKVFYHLVYVTTREGKKVWEEKLNYPLDSDFSKECRKVYKLLLEGRLRDFAYEIVKSDSFDRDTLQSMFDKIYPELCGQLYHIRKGEGIMCASIRKDIDNNFQF